MALAPSDAKSIFLAAVEQAAAERPAFLDRACGDNVALRRRVEALLQAYEEPGSFFDPAADRGAAAVDEPPVSEGHGTVIGSYKQNSLAPAGAPKYLYGQEFRSTPGVAPEFL